jgi:hypothetical protein
MLSAGTLVPVASAPAFIVNQRVTGSNPAARLLLANNICPKIRTLRLGRDSLLGISS